MVAVSGGVDSVSLLHGLRALPEAELVVAHFDHGIRPDSAADCRFVEALAGRYGLPFYAAEGRLGPRASEAEARQARYEFLRKVKRQAGARAIVTAHHQDDVLETAVINLLRGTGRRGLSSLRSREDIERPLLTISKAKILQYARENRLEWREDSTNTDETYLRNYVRRQVIAKLDEASRRRLADLINKNAQTNDQLDTLLVKYLPHSGNMMARQAFAGLPHAVAMEVMAAWLRQNRLRDFDSRTLERLVVGGKTARAGSRFDVRRSVKLRVSQDNLALVGLER